MEFSQGWSTGQDKTGLDALLKLEFHLELAGTKQWAESPRPSQLQQAAPPFPFTFLPTHGEQSVI